LRLSCVKLPNRTGMMQYWCSFSNIGKTPAVRSEVFPSPDLPYSTVIFSTEIKVVSFAMSSSRPKNSARSSCVKGLEPGYLALRVGSSVVINVSSERKSRWPAQRNYLSEKVLNDSQKRIGDLIFLYPGSLVRS